MQSRQRTWTLIATAVSFIAGIIFVLNDSAAGWFFIIMGFVYLGGLTKAGQDWSASNPSLNRWGFIGVTLLLILLIVVFGVVILLR
jgi:hypothetical protein